MVARYALAAGAALVVAAAVVIGIRHAREPVAPPPAPVVSSLAVIPLYDKADSGTAWLAEGTASAVGRALRDLPGVRVASARSATTYSSSWRDLRRLQDRLNVGAVLYIEAGRNAHGPVLVAMLKSAADDSTLFTRTYPAADNGLLAVEDSIASETARAVRTFGDSSKARVTRSPATANAHAHALFLRAMHQQAFLERPAHRRAVELLERAVALDSQYSAAWSALAASYLFLSDAIASSETGELREKAETAARRAIRLDSLSAEPHAVMAALYLARGDRTGAEREYSTAIRLDPQFPRARYEYALLLADAGRLGEALREIRRAHELEPLAADFHLTYIRMLERAGRAKEAREQQLEMRRLAR